MVQDSLDVEGQTPEQKRQLLARLMQAKAAAQPKSRKQAAMSFAQQRLWFLDQLTGGSALYNMACPQRLRFALDVEVLRRSLNEIVRRHETLRTTFGMQDGQPVQIIAPHLELELPVEDLQTHPPDKRLEEAERLATEEALVPFDLSRGPLVRAKLLRLAADDYLFLLTIHHIVSDGWSMGVFFRELNVLYAAYGAGQPSPLPELPIQYTDFSVWQQGWLEGEVLERQLGYWKRQLDGLATLELPTDRARPTLLSFKGASHPLSLDAEVVEALRALCREQDATLFMALFAAFQVLLHRYTGQEDIVVGSPVANRNRAETEGLIGFFVNSLVMRTSLAGDPTFRELLGRVRETSLGAYANQDLPFELLVEELHPERDLSRNPLFQVVFQLMDSSAMGDMTNAEQSAAQVPTLQMATAKFDLNLSLFVTPEGIQGAFEYATDLFDAPRIERMSGHYAKLLEAIVRNPDARISRLTMLTGAERRQILNEWNATAASIPAHERSVLESFERHAARLPQAPAVIHDGRTLAYGELERAANKLAWYLKRECGVAKGATVTVCLARSPEMIVAWLAALKAGAAYLPLDPEYPNDRLALMLAESGAAALVTDAALGERFAVQHAALVRLDADAALIEQHAESSSPATEYDEDALAYVIYTSGSTGKPKGVEIPHRGLTNLVNWHNRAFEVDAAARATQFAGVGFDAAVWEVWPYLAAGASIEIVPDAVRYSPRSLPQWLSDHAVTHCFIPTPILDIVLQEAWPQECRLRAVLTGGDKLRRGVPGGLPFAVFNQYGPTENAVVSTSARVAEEGADSDGVSAPPIGRPVSNVELFVVDRHGEPVAIGVPGELWIGGAGLARGYRNSPELTAERFVPHPLKAGARVYKSGDLVRFLPDGNLEFLGRVDEQVKIRGFRIEPGEIEAVLAREPNVQSVCVLVREVREATTEGEPLLVAYLVAKPEAALDVALLRAQAREKLPAYMVPSHFVVLDFFPLTANGKIDRAKLPLPTGERRDEDERRAPPRTQLEEWIASIWRQELRLEAVGVDENFFDVGGTSLTMVRIQRQLEEKLPQPLPVVDLFRYPTIRALAAYLNEKESGQTTVEKARERAATRRKRMKRPAAGELR